jgi:hypothetical protein
LALSQIKSIASHSAKGLLIEDFLGQGGNEGFTTELLAIALRRFLEDLVDMKGTAVSFEYILNNRYIRLTLSASSFGSGARAAQAPHRSQLSFHRLFEYIQ